MYRKSSSIKLLNANNEIAITAAYFPPNCPITIEQYKHFFQSQGNRFIVGGDFNAKHTHFGSRTTTTKGRRLLQVINEQVLIVKSTNKPTYWPSNPNKNPDMVDFFICHGFDPNHFAVIDCYDLSTDHSPVLGAVQLQFTKNHTKTKYTTNWVKFNDILKEENLFLPNLKSSIEIDNAVTGFTSIILDAYKRSSFKQAVVSTLKPHDIITNKLLAKKRQLRRPSGTSLRAESTWGAPSRPFSRRNITYTKIEMEKGIQTSEELG